MTLAIQAYKDGHFTSVRGAANAYDVPKSTLQARVNGRPTRHGLRLANLKLTATEELTLIQWILSMEERGLPLRANSVQQMANLLL